MSQPREQSPQVSVVIPTRRRPALLRRCLEALQAQQIPAESVEILVCDDGPDAATLEVVESLAQRRPDGPVLRYLVPGGEHGPAAARNRGWRQARAPVVAFTDDDTVPASDWLVRGLQAMLPGVSAVSGRIIMPLPPRPNDYERDASGLAAAEFATANCFVRREALEKVNGFDPRFSIAWREDSDLQFSLMEAGLTIVRAPDARVLHPIRPAGFAASLRMQRKIVFDSLLFRKHPKFYRERIRPGLPWFYLLTTLAGSIALGCALAGAWTTAGASFGLWALLTAWFFARRARGTSRRPRDLADLLVTSVLIPPLSIGWRVIGMARFGGGIP